MSKDSTDVIQTPSCGFLQSQGLRKMRRIVSADREVWCVCSCVNILSFFTPFREYKRMKVVKAFTMQLLALESYFSTELFRDTIPNQLCLQSIFVLITAAPSFGKLPLPPHQTMSLGAGGRP